MGRCFFQFYEDKLYIITITIRTDRLDHYAVFTKLCEKYGNPTRLSPDKSEWADSAVIMSLERPLTLKYTDRATFDRLQESSRNEKTAGEQSREDFLDSL